MNEQLDRTTVGRLCDEYVCRRVDQQRLLDELQVMIKSDDTKEIDAVLFNVHLAWQHRVRLKELVTTLEQAGYSEACFPAWSKHLLYYDIDDEIKPRVRFVAVLEQVRFVLAETEVQFDFWVDPETKPVRTKSKLYVDLKTMPVVGLQEKMRVLCLDLKSGTTNDYELPVVAHLMCEYISQSGDGDLTDDLLLLSSSASHHNIIRCSFPSTSAVVHDLDCSLKKHESDRAMDFFMSGPDCVLVNVGPVGGREGGNQVILCEISLRTSRVLHQYRGDHEFYMVKDELFSVEHDPRKARLFLWRANEISPLLLFETDRVVSPIHNCILIHDAKPCYLAYLAADGTGKVREVPQKLLT